MLGTPYYMAPEQVFGDRDVDGRADTWALGVIAYECLAGRRPVVEDNFGQIFKAIALEPIPELARVAPGVPPDVAALVMRMLEKSREVRPRLVEIKDLLSPYAEGAPSSVPRATPFRRGPALGLALLLMLGAAAFVFVRGARTEVAAPSPSNAAGRDPATQALGSQPPPSTGPTPVAATSGAVMPALSPTSSSLRPTAIGSSASATSIAPRRPPSAPTASMERGTELPGRVFGTSPY